MQTVRCLRNLDFGTHLTNLIILLWYSSIIKTQAGYEDVTGMRRNSKLVDNKACAILFQYL